MEIDNVGLVACLNLNQIQTLEKEHQKLDELKKYKII